MKQWSILMVVVLLMCTTVQAQQRAASVSYARAVAEAQALIEKDKKLGKDPPMPEPPSYDPPCDVDQRNKQRAQATKEVDAYFETVFGEGRRAVVKVGQAGKALAESGVTPVPDPISTILEIYAEVFYPKANSLLRQYGPNKGRKGSDEKFFAVSKIVLTVHKEMATASASGGGLDGKWADALFTWQADYLSSNLDKIRADHDYTRVLDVMEAHKALALISGSDGNLEEILGELQDALTFKLKLEGSYEMQAGGGGGKVTTEAEIKMTPDLQGIAEWGGKADGKYTFGEFKTDEAPLGIALDAFPIVAQLKNFDACKNMVVDVSFDRVAAKEDRMVYEGRPVAARAIIEPAAKAIFVISGNFQPSMGYSFPGLTLHNKQELAVDETIIKTQNADGGTAKAQIHIQLVHSPQGKGMKKRKLQTAN